MAEADPSEQRIVRQLVEEFDFIDPDQSEWFLKSMTHRSFANEAGIDYDNERLEFLGDAVLDLIVCEMLFRDFPDLDEGRLSEFKSAVVNTSALTRIAHELNLESYLRLSKGESQTKRGRDKVVADSLEAFIGAIYLTSGLEDARRFIQHYFEDEMQIYLTKGARNYKGTLLEYTQEHSLPDPRYEVESVEGPEHNPIYTIEVYVEGTRYGVGEGSTKKDAEQEAARVALESLAEDDSLP